jgi:hypothetical protein
MLRGVAIIKHFDTKASKDEIIASVLQFSLEFGSHPEGNMFQRSFWLIMR